MVRIGGVWDGGDKEGKGHGIKKGLRFIYLYPYLYCRYVE